MKPKVAFVCVHNSCRSQMAEALGRHLAGDVFESFSAGTEERDRINPDAVRFMKERYGIDMEKDQSPKLLDALPPVDIVIKMGCNVVCPYVPGRYVEDWGLDDPSGKADEEFLKTMDRIEENVRLLAERIRRGDPDLKLKTEE